MSESANKDLKNFVDKIAQTSHLRVEKDLGDGYFRLRATEAQRRQAKQDIRCCEDAVIEMLRNSRDAGAKNIFLATNNEEGMRNILVLDDGSGVPVSHHKTIFEPYVTSKLDSVVQDSWGVHGRGMALYSIAQNSERAELIKSDTNLGCSILAVCNTKKLHEKTDQSTFPNFSVNDDEELVVRGPKNILRTVCEFGVEGRGKIKVYVGSPVEIAATLYCLSKSKNNIKSVFSEPDEKTKIVDLLGYSSDVHDFKEYAREIGINLSKRTARRIMDGDILPQPDILTRISHKGIISFSNNLDTNKMNKKGNSVYDIFDIKRLHKTPVKKKIIKIDKEDKESIKDAVKQKYLEFADKYYLDKNIEPVVTIKNNKITINLEMHEIE